MIKILIYHVYKERHRHDKLLHFYTISLNEEDTKKMAQIQKFFIAALIVFVLFAVGM
jgi:hypothetical protein